MRIKFYLVLFVALSVCGIAAGQNSFEELKKEVSQSITADELMSYVEELTHPRYKGRLAGSP